MLALIGAPLALLAHHLLRPRAHTVVGSTTTEFITTPAAPIRRIPAKSTIAWPTYGFDAARSRNVSVDLEPPYKQRWVFHGRALLEFPPAIAHGLVYLPTFDGRLYALSAATGTVRWMHRMGRCGWASPAVSAGVVYVTFIGSSECHSHRPGGEVDAFDARTGRLQWHRNIGPTESSPLVLDGEVIVGDWNGRVWALAVRTGRTLWQTATGSPVKGSVAAGYGRLFIGNYGGKLFALAPRTGRILWTSSGHGSFYSSPAVAYGRVYIGSLDDGIYAFGAATGHVLWSRPTGSYVYASPAIADGLVLVGSYDHRFYALDAGTGVVRWRVNADDRISGAASVIGRLVFFSTFGERTFALNVRTGRRIGAWHDGKYSPAVTDGERVFLVGEGRLYALTVFASK